MRGLFVLSVALHSILGWAQTQPCNSIVSMDQCALDCNCQRVACCCGEGCTKKPGTEIILYSHCVAATAPPEQWGCPSDTSCGQDGLERKISPCEVDEPTPAPAPGPGGMPGLAPGMNMPFGTTFPMIGTQAVNGNTWHHNVWMGTNMAFNPGAFWHYTDSFFVPKIVHKHPDGTVDDPDSHVPVAPTPVPDYTGQLCYGYLKPCPDGYYCQVELGYHPDQKGRCYKQSSNNWGGQGWWGGQNGNQGNGPDGVNHGNQGTMPGGGFGADNWFATNKNSCKPPSVCGYQSVGGTCWCDSECATTGDCCSDAEKYCPIANPNKEGSTIQECNNAALKGDCSGRCGPGVVVHDGGKCYCDGNCLAYNDCCCNYQTACA